MDQRIIELSHWPYFPSILGLQVCPRCDHVARLAAFWSLGKWRKNCKRCRDANLTPNQRAARKTWNTSPKGRLLFQRRMREFRRTPEGRERHHLEGRLDRERYPDRYAARHAVARAIASGKLKRQPCERCGELAEAHHPNYSKPLEVIWLCNRHHHDAHNQIGEPYDTQNSHNPSPPDGGC